METKTEERMERAGVTGQEGVLEQTDLSRKTGGQERVGARREYVNEMLLEFDAVSLTESFARILVSAFITPLNPTVE